MLLALPAMQTMFLTDVRLFAGQLNTLLRTNAQTNAAAVALRCDPIPHACRFDFADRKALAINRPLIEIENLTLSFIKLKHDQRLPGCSRINRLHIRIPFKGQIQQSRIRRPHLTSQRYGNPRLYPRQRAAKRFTIS